MTIISKPRRDHRLVRLATLVSLVFAMTLGAATPVSAGDGEMEIEVSGSLDWSAPCTAMKTDYAFGLTGDITGCVYGNILSEEYNEETGEYQSRDHEYWHVSVAGLSGTWESNESFYALFDPDTGAQISGGCEHPIIEGSGTGDFESVDGEIRFVDDVVNGTADYFGVVKIGG